MLLSLYYFYFLIFIFCFNVNNILMLFLLLESMSWIFSFFLKKSMLKYLVVQSFFFLGGLFSVLFAQMFLIVFLLLKLGLPPFYSWVVSLMTQVNKLVFLFFFTIHKLLPMFFMKNAFSFFPSVMISSLVISLLMLFQTSSLFFIFIMSSFVQSIWLIFCIVLSTSLFFSYWFFYSVSLWMFFSFLVALKMSLLSYLQSFMSMLMWLLIMGLPPFMMFWLKFSLLCLMLNSFSIWLVLILLFSSIVSMLCYYRGFNSFLAVVKKNSGSITFLTPFVFLFF